MISRRRRSVRSRFQFQIRTLFTLAAVKDYIGLIFRSTTVFTNRLTPERHGFISDCVTANRSRSWRSIRKIRIEFLLQSPVIPTGLTRSAAFIDRSMAEKRSRKFFIAMRTSARAMCRSIRAIPRLFMLRCGNRAKPRGKTACSMATTAASSNPSTAERRGDS